MRIGLRGGLAATALLTGLGLAVGSAPAGAASLPVIRPAAIEGGVLVERASMRRRAVHRRASHLYRCRYPDPLCFHAFPHRSIYVPYRSYYSGYGYAPNFRYRIIRPGVSVFTTF